MFHVNTDANNHPPKNVGTFLALKAARTYFLLDRRNMQILALSNHKFLINTLRSEFNFAFHITPIVKRQAGDL